MLDAEPLRLEALRAERDERYRLRRNAIDNVHRELLREINSTEHASCALRPIDCRATHRL